MSGRQAPDTAPWRWWRMPRGPLARRTDRVETASRWVVAALLLLSLPVGLAVGTVVSTDLRELAAEQAASRAQVPAVLLEDAPAGDTGAGVVRAAAAWTAPDGSPRHGDVWAPAGTVAGDSVRIWVEVPAGDPSRQPLSPGAARVQGILGVVVAWVLTASVLASGHLGLRVALDRRRDRRWTAEWARVEPVWAGRATSEDA